MRLFVLFTEENKSLCAALGFLNPERGILVSEGDELNIFDLRRLAYISDVEIITDAERTIRRSQRDLTYRFANWGQFTISVANAATIDLTQFNHYDNSTLLLTLPEFWDFIPKDWRKSTTTVKIDNGRVDFKARF